MGAMTNLTKLLSKHPLDAKPYNAIVFARLDQHDAPLYLVTGSQVERGAKASLKAAFELYGANCFHCGKFMPAQPMSKDCTRDHLRPRKDGGGDHLHNLVYSCGPCNLKKGCDNLISFQAESGEKYLRSLVAHLERCLAQMIAEQKQAKPTAAKTKRAAAG